MAGTYKIVCKPEDRGEIPAEGGDEKNYSAMVVKLTNGSHTSEVCRVGFDRSNTKNPTVSLEDQLGDAIGRARTAVGILNEQLAPNGDLQ